MGPTGILVLDSTNSAIASARREKAEASIESESLSDRVVGETRRTWGRELTPNLEKEDWDSLNSMSQKKSLEAEGRPRWLAANDSETMANSERSWGRWSSDLERKELASKKMIRW
ncbi:hypothetical protein KFK09_002940 [Dendrobium nobile]|uniref:Uncharacterized protein n=1 Tax=Dendrobium nobile TaxID=94219 RepID=A0A8T3C7Q5_DENNO|nr:hypothetical protein KFK09_002940 [Dendrobium nobile]